MRGFALKRALAVTCMAVFACGVGMGEVRAADSSLSKRKLPAVRLDTPPVIDGDITDPIWSTAARAETFSDRSNGNTRVEQTVAWIGYNDEAIFVAFQCFDSQPEKIVAREIRRDASPDGEDAIQIRLDPFRLRRDVNRFTINALGTPSAFLAGGRAAKLEWKGEWVSAAKRVADGWTAEVRIPWEILAYPTSREPVTMGINFIRFHERPKVRSDWSNLGTQGLDELDGDWEGVQLPQRKFRQTLSLLPYTVFQSRLADTRSRDFGFGRGRMLNLGLDARLAVTPELTAVGTINPDFSTVERAVAGIDFARGERFIPDTRPFFLDGTDYFRANVAAGRAWGNAFFSGRIPAFDLGGKAYGRVGRHETIGVLATTAFDTGRHDFVGRWLHDVGSSSTVGTYLVHRSLPGDDNSVLGVNKSIRKGPWFLRSDFSYAAGDRAGGGAVSSGVRWDHGDWSLHTAYNRVDSGFRAENGFVPFRDFHGPDASVSFYKESRTGPIRDYGLYWLVNQHWRTDGDFFRRLVELNCWLETRTDWAWSWGWNGGRFLDQRDSEFRIGFTRNASNRYNRTGIDYRFGKRADRPIQFVQPYITRRLFGKWDVSASTSILAHDEDHNQQIITFGRELSPYRQVGGRIVILDGTFHYFLSYRVSGGKGMEMFFLLGDPLTSIDRTRTRFAAKFVFPISVR